MKGPELPFDLVQVLASVEPSTLARILTDLLSPSEVQSVSERWAIVKGLAAGETQREVRDRVGVAVATVSRGARQLKYGNGGFAAAFDALAALGLADPRRAAGGES